MNADQNTDITRADEIEAGIFSVDEIAHLVTQAVLTHGGRVSTAVDQAAVRLAATCLVAFYQTHDTDGSDDAAYLEFTMTCLRNLLPLVYPRLPLWDHLAEATDRFGNVDPVDGFAAIDAFIWP